MRIEYLLVCLSVTHIFCLKLSLLDTITWWDLLVLSNEQFEDIDDSAPEFTDARDRLMQRVGLYGLHERYKIEGDGNCQFAAIADQLMYLKHPQQCSAQQVRRLAVKWLVKNSKHKLANKSTLDEYMYDGESYAKYCKRMAGDKIWGDHLTLYAISNVFGVHITLVSSVEGDQFITTITPADNPRAGEFVLLLSHLAEFHYGSLYPAGLYNHPMFWG